MKRVIAIIPARMGSSRFPGKPMALINNMPMIGHVYEAVSACKDIEKTIVATCDLEIFEYIESIGGQAVMTKNTHDRASDRCAEALLILEKEESRKYDIVVMVQGDEPMTVPEMISESITPMLDDSSILVTNLISDIDSYDEFIDKNCIKVVCDLNQNAVYFSREAIPTLSKSNSVQMKKQVCIIPFKRDFLLEYTNLSETPLEIAESIDMLRVIEHGYKVRMVQTSYKTFAVDTPEDLKKVESLLKK